MPTFSTIALENLLEPRVRDSYKKPQDSKRIAPLTLPDVGEDARRPDGDTKTERRSVNHIYISPALYITPEPAPIPETSSESLSPSPYVVNHKRRGGEVAAVGRRVGGFEVDVAREKEVEVESGLDLGKNGDGVGLGGQEMEEELVEDNFIGLEVNGDGCGRIEGGDEGFLDPKCDSWSIGSPNEVRQLECRSFLSTQAEFFDADEDFSSDGSIGANYARSESELRGTRLRLLEEIERRKAAEDSLQVLQDQWLRISNMLSHAGLSLPVPSNANGSMQFEDESMEQLSQEVVVARFVAEAIGRGEARAEVELAAEAIIESKNQEISRLRDRLQYYEAVNQEMSHRNQEIIEEARRRRQRRKAQWKWLWRSIGFSAAIGISLIAYSYLPSTIKSQEGPKDSSDGSDATTTTIE